MRSPSSGQFPRSRADLEPILRLVAIPVACMVVGALCGLAYSLSQSTLYASQSQVVVSPASGFLDPSHSDAFAAISTTVQELALTQNVLRQAVAILPAGKTPVRTPSELRSRLRLSISGDTPLLTVEGVDGSQAVASAVSTAEATALVTAINAASATPASTVAPSGLKLEAFTLGEPRGQLQPKTSRNFLLGASAGLIIGCFGLAQLLSRSRRRSE